MNTTINTNSYKVAEMETTVCLFDTPEDADYIDDCDTPRSAITIKYGHKVDYDAEAVDIIILEVLRNDPSKKSKELIWKYTDHQSILDFDKTLQAFFNKPEIEPDIAYSPMSDHVLNSHLSKTYGDF